MELQDCVGRLQTLNSDLQSRLSQMEKSEHVAYNQEDKAMASSSPWKQVRGHKRQMQMGDAVMSKFI